VQPIILPARLLFFIPATAPAIDAKTRGTTIQNIILMKIVPMGSSAVAPGQTAPTMQPATMPMIMQIKNP